MLYEGGKENFLQFSFEGQRPKPILHPPVSS